MVVFSVDHLGKVSSFPSRDPRRGRHVNHTYKNDKTRVSVSEPNSQVVIWYQLATQRLNLCPPGHAMCAPCGRTRRTSGARWRLTGETSSRPLWPREPATYRQSGQKPQERIVLMQNQTVIPNLLPHRQTEQPTERPTERPNQTFRSRERLSTS